MLINETQDTEKSTALATLAVRLQCFTNSMYRGARRPRSTCYAHLTTEVWRSLILFGTTNDPRFLLNHKGDRCFRPVVALSSTSEHGASTSRDRLAGSFGRGCWSPRPASAAVSETSREIIRNT